MEYLIPELQLDSGQLLAEVPIHFRVKGDVHRQPVVWVFHALTANDDPTDWWSGLFGAQGYFDDKFAVICANMLGSPYGSFSPVKGKQKGKEFPNLTIRDTAKAQIALAKHLKIEHIHTLIGGSCGGYQALEFALGATISIDHMILLATGAREMPWNKAIHEAQRLALQADPTLWQGGGAAGLKAARGIGLLNYRTSEQFNKAQTDDLEATQDFRAPSYIRYQGQKLVDRFDAASYYKLTEQLDTHHVGRGRGGLEKALSNCLVKTLILGIDSDVLIPLGVQEELANYLPNAEFKILKSAFGHDGFLLEYEQITKEILNFYHA
jgi:homoserine O-acetyltransferase